MPDYSESLENLRQFIDICLEPNFDKVSKANPEMDTVAEALDKLDDEVIATGNLLDSELEEAATAIDASADMAIDAIGALEKAAQAGAREDLPEMGTQMDAAAEAFVKAANGVDSDLDEAGTNLDSSGFQDAIKDLGAAEEALDEAASAVASAFDSVASGVTSLATELAAGLQDAAGKAGAAGGELDGHAQDIETEGQAAVQAVTAACNEQAAAYQGMKGDLDGFYEGQKGAVLSEGDSFKDCVRKLLEAQDEQARTNQVEPLSGPMDIIIDTVLEPHNQELDKWEDTVAKATAASDELKELVSDLKRSKKVAEQIDEIGKAVGGG